MLQRPDPAHALFVFAHGAGAGMRHRFMQALADELAAQGVATFRYEFPYLAAGKRRIDPQPVLEARVREAVAEAHRLAPDLPLFAGGKSLGGRMTSNAQAKESLAGVRGLVFVGFPLHPAKQPARARGDHLAQVTLPMLFLQGTRDDLAELGLIRAVCAQLGPRATLHEIDGADHSFAVRKASGRTDADVLRELAVTVSGWTRTVSRA
jgi:predicted alpha/beta-hydrolase family hydrolase